MNLVSEKEFLDLPLVSVAEIVRCRGPKVSVFPFDGTRRWFHLECNPQYDDYQQAALRQSIRILKMLFEHGIETVISPIFSDDLLDRGDRYIVQALEGMALLANDEEILSFYKEHEVHVLFYGDYKKRLPSTAQGAAVVKSFDDLTISTSSNTAPTLNTDYASVFLATMRLSLLRSFLSRGTKRMVNLPRGERLSKVITASMLTRLTCSSDLGVSALSIFRCSAQEKRVYTSPLLPHTI